ncbi:MAG: hypothetical protein ABSF95_01140 [Verrucomicrobiota bacterium]|jgi:hypothetical protein
MAANKKRARQRNRPPQKRPPWLREEVTLFRLLYRQTPNLVLARRLQRTLQAITSKAHKLRLRKAPERLVRMGRENIAHRWGKQGRRRRPA